MDAIRLDLTGDVARITIDRPEKRNALGMAELSALGACLTNAAAAPVRALVLTGAGDRAFSAGVDLSDVSDTGNWDENPLTALCDQLQAFPMPTIARLNGAVIGGAAELSMSCDFRIGVEGMKLMVPAARIGIHYEPSGLTRAAAVLGWQGAKRLYLLAETVSGDALSDSGYLDRQVAREGLDDAVEEMLEALRLGAPLAVNGMKRTFADLIGGAADPAEIRARIRATWASEDLKEGLAAARDRRRPDFKGH